MKELLGRAGYEIRRSEPQRTTPQPLAQLLSFLKIDCVFDVGANSGQFAQLLRHYRYSGKIVSFEPLLEPWEKLNSASENDAAWLVHPRCAVGEREGVVSVNVAANSYSSSILGMLEQHCRSAPESIYIGQQETELVPLSSVFEKYAHGYQNVLVKIDTQGYERQVLDGCGEVLDRVKAIYIELSLAPLYQGQELWRYFVERLQNEGFAIWSIQPAFTDRNTGRTLQIDVLFVRDITAPMELRP